VIENNNYAKYERIAEQSILESIKQPYVR